MKKLILLVTVIFTVIMFIGNVSAATVKVNWGTVYSYKTKSNGTQNVAQLKLDFGDINTYGFCVEPTISISKADYNYDFLPWTEDYYKAAWLMENYAQTPNTIDTEAETVGIQSSIWAAVADNGYAPKYGKSGYTEYNRWYSSIPGSFDQAEQAELEHTYKIMKNYDSYGRYQTLIVKYPSAVPVPAAVWLLGSGLVGLVGARRKLKK